MPTVIEFFQWCFYVVVGSIVLAICVLIIGTALIEVRKRWSRG